MPLPRSPLDDPRVLALAKARQQLTHDCTFPPTWDELTDKEPKNEADRQPADQHQVWLITFQSPPHRQQRRLGGGQTFRRVSVERGKLAHVQPPAKSAARRNSSACSSARNPALARSRTICTSDTN